VRFDDVAKWGLVLPSEEIVLLFFYRSRFSALFLAFRPELFVKANQLFAEKQEKNDIGKRHHIEDGFVDASCSGASALLVRLGDQTALRAALGMQ
jgi:hypothetical protein